MKLNMTNIDRIVRILISVIFAALFLTGTVSGVVGYILLAIAIIFPFTSLFGFCPIYWILGLNFRKKQNTQAS